MSKSSNPILVTMDLRNFLRKYEPVIMFFVGMMCITYGLESPLILFYAGSKIHGYYNIAIEIGLVVVPIMISSILTIPFYAFARKYLDDDDPIDVV